MKVTADISKGDLIRVNWALLPKLKSTYIYTACLAVLIFFVTLYFRGFAQTPGEWVFMVLLSVFSATMGMLGSVVVSIIYIFMSSSKCSGVLGNHQYEINDEGLYEETSVNQGLAKWEGIQTIRVVGGYLLFQITGYLFHIIPKRSFSSEQEFEDFVDQSMTAWKRVQI